MRDYPNLARYGGDDVLNGRHNPSFTWNDLEALREHCPLPLVVKGVLDADDAWRAVQVGCDGVWVSNHGGRQLDRTIATLDALEMVASRLDGAAELYLDGGVRSGVDVLIGLAVGATAVFIGRPAAYGLTVAGSQGVQAVLTDLRRQLEGAMALSGCPTLADVDRRLIR